MLTEKVIATNIRNTREAKNYSQFYIAYKLNISQNTLSKIELGYVKLTVSRLIEIARVLEVDLLDLLADEGDLNSVLNPDFALAKQSVEILNFN